MDVEQVPQLIADERAVIHGHASLFPIHVDPHQPARLHLQAFHLDQFHPGGCEQRFGQLPDLFFMGLHGTIPPSRKKSGLKPTHQNPPMIFAFTNTKKDRLQGKKRLTASLQDRRRKKWSGRWDSNPRRPAWEADILPLNYARSTKPTARLPPSEMEAHLKRQGYFVKILFASSLRRTDRPCPSSPSIPAKRAVGLP